jgi:hypothetical protein
MSFHPNFKNEDGSLEQFAWPGGYLVEWINEYGDTLCAKCATNQLTDGVDVTPHTHEAGSEGFTCENCGEEKR